MSDAEWEAWDKKIELDLLEGRFDKLIAQAKEAHRKGLTLPYEEGMSSYYQARSSRNDDKK